MATKLDARQTISRDTLNQLAAASGVELDNLLLSIDSELTAPLVLRENSPADLVVSVGAISITNPETGRQKTITPISNVLPTFASGTITLDATGAGNATPSAGSALALGMNASEFLKIGVSLDANGDLVLQAGTAGASEALATNPPLVPNTHAIGYIVVETDGSNNVQPVAAADIFQYFGSGGGGSGSGNANADLETLKNQLQDSNWEFVTPNSFVSDGDDLVDAASTGAYSLVSTRFVMDAIGETLVTKKLTDAEFNDLKRDIPEIEASIIYDIDNIDDAPTVEISRDGGNEWQTPDLERLGNTDTYIASHKFTEESTSLSIESDLTSDGTRELNITTDQAVSQGFSFAVAAGSQIVKTLQLGFTKIGSPSGAIRLALYDDNAGVPGSIITISDAVNVSSITNGVNSVSIPRTVLLENTTYHLVVTTDTDYKNSFVASTTSLEVNTQSAGSDADNFDGTTWAAIGGGLQYGLRGYELDLRLRITASDPTGDNAENEFRLRSFGVFYDRNLQALIGSKKIDRFDFSSLDNDNVFTLNFVPDPDLLNIYYIQAGQVFRIDNETITLSGSSVSFPVDTFDNGGIEADVTLIFAELQGYSFDNSDSNAAKLAEHTVNLDALGEKSASLDMVDVAEIAVPNTEISGRAKIKDLASIPSAQMGIERVHLTAIELVKDEVGPSNQLIYKSANNDHLDRIRLVGEWVSRDDTFVGRAGRLPGAVVTDGFVEITFYGTGLNFNTVYNHVNLDVRATVDGGAESSNLITGYDAILFGRNYRPNAHIVAAAGLSLGIHTVKIRQAFASIDFHMLGFEIINDSAGIDINAGDVIHKEDRLSIPAATDLSYNSGFDTASDAVGTRGGHAVVYGERQSNGTIEVKKRFNAVDSQLNLAAADHSNEEMIRRINWREFGEGRADDFSTITPDDGAIDKFFTLDDGTTSLVADQAQNSGTLTSDKKSLHMASGGFWTLTFVGTGLDVVATNELIASSASYDILVDGVSIGTQAGKAIGNDDYIIPIVSGLPYGTHTIKADRTSGFAFGMTDFIIYGPKKPSIPTDAVELGSYNLMADFSVSAAGLDTISAGTLRKAANREFVYGAGTSNWIASTNPDQKIMGTEIYSPTQNDFIEFNFYGTGFDVRAHNIAANGPENVLVEIDDGSGYVDLNTTNYPTITKNERTSTYNLATAVYSQGAGTAVGGGIAIKDIPLGHYRVKMTNTLASRNFRLDAIDIITPIHVNDASRNLVIDSDSEFTGSNSIKSEMPLAEHKQGKQYLHGGLGPIKLDKGDTVLDWYQEAEGIWENGSCIVKWKATRIGNMVNVTQQMTTVNAAIGSVSSGTNHLPIEFRPNRDIETLQQTNSGTIIANIKVHADGSLKLQGLSASNLGSQVNFNANWTGFNFVTTYSLNKFN